MTDLRQIKKLLIANRGEIACRVMATAESLGIKTVAVYSDADGDARHVRLADEAVHIGPAPAAESYLIGDKIIDAAKRTGADAIHPGYGFLSENPEFADRVVDSGLMFLGPSAAAMRAMALKGAAKALMTENDVPVVPGYHGDDQSAETLSREAERIGYPVLIKAVAGGGGKGMRRVDHPDDLEDAVQSAAREGQASFGNPKLLIEKYLVKPRHIEFQIFGDSHGTVVHLWERDCSLQRRHQKVLEEAPAPGMTPGLRDKMGAAAVRAAEAISYVGAGTVEFIVDVANGLENAPFYFMEMNTRLQVEHPVTEMITGQDLVEWQIRIAEGHALPFSQDEIDATVYGHAIEARLYAEDPYNGFVPQTGRLEAFDALPKHEGDRIDTGVERGDSVTIHYDPMIAKMVFSGEDRDDAINGLIRLLGETPVSGLTNNRDFLIASLDHPAFRSGQIATDFIALNEAELLTKPTATAEDYAVAAIAVLANRQALAVHDDPWAAKDSFQLNLASTEILPLRQDDRNVDVMVSGTLPGLELTVDGQLFEIADAHLRDSYLTATLNGIRSDWSVTLSDETVELHLSKHSLSFTRPDKKSLSSEEMDGPGDVKAPMPGKILSVSVANGDAVNRGDALLIMEAMKMEQTIKAPRTGMVSNLSVTAGDQVGDNTLLLTITDELPQSDQPS